MRRLVNETQTVGLFRKLTQYFQPDSPSLVGIADLASRIRDASAVSSRGCLQRLTSRIALFQR